MRKPVEDGMAFASTDTAGRSYKRDKTHRNAYRSRSLMYYPRETTLSTPLRLQRERNQHPALRPDYGYFTPLRYCKLETGARAPFAPSVL
jgi:hypothetical protein